MPFKDKQKLKEWRDGRREKHNLEIKEWRLKNPARTIEISKKSYYKNQGKKILAAREYRIKNKDKLKIIDKNRRYKTHIKWKYNITLEDYNLKVQKQNGLCAICKITPDKKLYIDHNHITGKIRGLLCMKCNSGLGMFNDEIKLLLNAINYIQNE